MRGKQRYQELGQFGGWQNGRSVKSGLEHWKMSGEEGGKKGEGGFYFFSWWAEELGGGVATTGNSKGGRRRERGVVNQGGTMEMMAEKEVTEGER